MAAQGEEDYATTAAAAARSVGRTVIEVMVSSENTVSEQQVVQAKQNRDGRCGGFWVRPVLAGTSECLQQQAVTLSATGGRRYS